MSVNIADVMSGRVIIVLILCAGVIGYSALGSVAGVGLILQAVRSQQWLASSFFALFGVLLCAHARVVASYMVRGRLLLER